MGRKKGDVNKLNRAAKIAITEIVDGNSGKAQEMLDMIVDPKDWLALYVKLAEFVVPKKAAVNVSTEERKCDLKSELQELSKKEI